MKKSTGCIGSIIKKRRLELGYTRKHLGRIIGKTECSIKKYETAEIDIPFSVLIEICQALKLVIRFVPKS